MLHAMYQLGTDKQYHGGTDEDSEDAEKHPFQSWPIERHEKQERYRNGERDEAASFARTVAANRKEEGHPGYLDQVFPLPFHLLDELKEAARKEGISLQDFPE